MRAAIIKHRYDAGRGREDIAVLDPNWRSASRGGDLGGVEDQVNGADRDAAGRQRRDRASCHLSATGAAGFNDTNHSVFKVACVDRRVRATAPAG